MLLFATRIDNVKPEYQTQQKISCLIGQLVNIMLYFVFAFNLAHTTIGTGKQGFPSA